MPQNHQPTIEAERPETLEPERHVLPEDSVKVQDEVAARQGVTGHKVRYVLSISTALAAAALGLILLIWVL